MPLGRNTLKELTYVVSVVESPILFVLKEVLIPDTVELRVLILVVLAVTKISKLVIDVERVVVFNVKELILCPIVVVLLLITALESPKQSVPSIAVKEIIVLEISVAIYYYCSVPEEFTGSSFIFNCFCVYSSKNNNSCSLEITSALGASL